MSDSMDQDCAPPVTFEPCSAFRLDHDSVWAVCGGCGWLEDDHPVLDAAEPVAVAELRIRRARVSGVRPARKAS